MTDHPDPEAVPARCRFCNYPSPAHSDICRAWHERIEATPSVTTKPDPKGLLACPFCGPDSGRLEVTESDASSPYKVVTCFGCVTEGPLGKTEDDAIRLWNTRPSPEPIDLCPYAEERVITAARQFLAKYDECSPEIDGAFTFMEMHSGPYTGPNYGEELKALRAAVAAEEIPPGPERDAAMRGDGEPVGYEGVVADAIEKVIDNHPAVDAAPSRIRRIRAENCARAAIAALSGLGERR